MFHANWLSRLVLIASIYGTFSPLAAQEITHIDGLGSLSFPNSGSEAAQHDFLRGVLLLHSFEYGFAAEAFRAAQEADPRFALAYWGEAMTHTHPVWNEKNTDAARSVLNRLAPSAEEREALAPTERERAYMRAAHILYGEGEKAAVDTLYANEMAGLAQAYPSDLEAQSLYALALLGLSQGDRDVPTYMQAGAIALDAFEKNPDHPGAAHYAIHAFDDPTHAPLAMKAARAYAPLAPNAAHAQHMTSHIFLAVGLWDDVVDANLRADAVVDDHRGATGLPSSNCGHYNEWLTYGYQQQGRYDEAEDLTMRCFDEAREAVFTSTRRHPALSYALVRNLYLADTRDYGGAPATSLMQFPDESLGLVGNMMQAWGNGVIAAHQGDLAAAQSQLQFLRDNETALPEGYIGPYAPVWRGTLEAYLLAHSGDNEAALTAAHEAAEYEASLPVDFGPPLAFKPARELEGEILLSLGRADDAMAAFAVALRRTPNRILSLVGYGRSAALAGRTNEAQDAHRRLLELLKHADTTVTRTLSAVHLPSQP